MIFYRNLILNINLNSYLNGCDVLKLWLQNCRSYLCAIWHKDIFKLYLFFDVLFYNDSTGFFPVDILGRRA